MTHIPFDRGLQPERTLLAWRRTCLALAVGGALGLRLTSHLGVAVALAGVACIVAATAAGVAADGRYRRMHLSLLATGWHAEGAVPLALLAGAALLLALCALLVVAGTVGADGTAGMARA